MQSHIGPHQLHSGCPSLTYSQIQKPPGPPTSDRRQNMHPHGIPVGQDTDNSIYQEQHHQALLKNNQKITHPVEFNMRHSKHGHIDGYSDTDNSVRKLDNLVDHIQVQSQQFPVFDRYQPLTTSNVRQKLDQRYPVGPDNPITSCQLQDPRSLNFEQSQHQSNRERNQPQQSCNQLYSLPPQLDTSSNRAQASVQHNTSSNQPRPSVQQPDSSSSQSEAPQQQPEVPNGTVRFMSKKLKSS